MYNHLRDTALVEHLFDDWSEANTSHKVAVFGMPHLHAVIRAARRREIISAVAYEKYVRVAQGIGHRLIWWQPDGGLQMEPAR